MIEETRTAPRRGAVEHYYRANAKTLFPAKGWRKLKEGLRAVVGAGQARKANGDGGEAVGYTFALLAFEAAWEPADLHAPVARGKWVARPSANEAGQNGGGSKRGGKREAGVARK